MIKRFNYLLAKRITLALGTMWAFYIFFLYALLPLVFPQAMDKLMYWSNVIQLITLPILAVGTSILGEKGEERAKQDDKAIMEQLNTIKKMHREVKVIRQNVEVAGSLFMFAGFLTIWIVWNVLPFTYHIDPSPFILLNLFLSFLTGFQAPIIMMIQNRQAERDKREAGIDFAINYKAEREIDNLQDCIARVESKLSNLEKLMKEIEEIKQSLASINFKREGMG